MSEKKEVAKKKKKEHVKECEIDPEVMKKWKILRSDRSDQLCAMIVNLKVGKKCSNEDTTMVLEEFMMYKKKTKDEKEVKIDWEDIAEVLDQSEGSFIFCTFTYQLNSFRKKSPLLFFHFLPQGMNPKHNVLHTKIKKDVIGRVFKGISASYEFRDPDDLDEEFVFSKLQKPTKKIL